MTTATQHISPNPALDFAKGILEETNGALELIEILRDIADGVDEKATTNDRIAANIVLADRGLGKCPKQVSPSLGPSPDPDSSASSESPSVVPHNEPESPRIVTQIDNSLNQSIGPAPSAHTEPALSLPKGQSTDLPHSAEHDIPESPAPFNPYSIHLTIQQHILAITNNGQTIRDNLLEIARAEDDPKACPEQEPALSLSKPVLSPVEGPVLSKAEGPVLSKAEGPVLSKAEGPVLSKAEGPVLSKAEGPVLSKAEGGRRITTYHRRRATTILIDRLLGTDPNALRSAVCPECRRKWTTHPGSHDHPESDRKVSPGRKVRYIDPEALAEVRAEIQRMKDEGILTPDPNAPKIDISMYRMPKDFDATPYAKEAAAKFWANIELRLERQKQWPAIEERRRKKLAQIYPSHSEDESGNSDPPDP